MDRLTFLGDVFLPRPVSVQVEFDTAYVFNLEYPITSATAGWPHKVNLRAVENHIPQTFDSRPVAVDLANNHIMDFGAAGLGDTRTELAKSRIGAYGAGSSDENAGNPLMLEEHGVALLGYACPSTAAVLMTPDHPGAAPLQLARITRDIAAARRAGARRVVVSLHWGEEEVFLPKPTDIALGRAIVEAGADLIVGHHAHCVQPFEQHRGRFIFYGLGNCIMPDLDEPSYFDESGRSTRNFVKTQHWWNRQSLAVDYTVETGAVAVRHLEFDGESLRAVKRRPGRHTLRAENPAQYERRYRRAFSRGKLRTKVMTWVTHPPRPRARHLKSLFKIAREVTSPRY